MAIAKQSMGESMVSASPASITAAPNAATTPNGNNSIISNLNSSATLAQFHSLTGGNQHEQSAPPTPQPQAPRAQGQQPQPAHCCAGCQMPIKDRFLFSVIEQNFHQDCVRCADCSGPLNDRCYTFEGKLYCRLDYWRRFGPKCSGCCESIKPTELVQRLKENLVYHLSCFVCQDCKRHLQQGEQLHLIDERRLLCKQDYLNTQNSGHNHNNHNNHNNNNHSSAANNNSLGAAGPKGSVLANGAPAGLGGGPKTAGLARPNGCPSLVQRHRACAGQAQVQQENRRAEACVGVERALGADERLAGGSPAAEPAHQARHPFGLEPGLAEGQLESPRRALDELLDDDDDAASSAASEFGSGQAPFGAAGRRGPLAAPKGGQPDEQQLKAAAGAPGAQSMLECAPDGELVDANGKRRGPRTTIKPKQLETLRRAFESAPKPSRHIREQLAAETGLNMRVIQVWFQNRRSKERRMKNSNGGARRNFFRSSSRRLRVGASGGAGPQQPGTPTGPAGPQSLMAANGAAGRPAGSAPGAKTKQRRSPQLEAAAADQQQARPAARSSPSDFGGSSSGGFTYFSDSSNPGDAFAINGSGQQQQQQYPTSAGPTSVEQQPPGELMKLESPPGGAQSQLAAPLATATGGASAQPAPHSPYMKHTPPPQAPTSQQAPTTPTNGHQQQQQAYSASQHLMQQPQLVAGRQPAAHLHSASQAQHHQHHHLEQQQQQQQQQHHHLQQQQQQQQQQQLHHQHQHQPQAQQHHLNSHQQHHHQHQHHHMAHQHPMMMMQQPAPVPPPGTPTGPMGASMIGHPQPGTQSVVQW